MVLTGVNLTTKLASNLEKRLINERKKKTKKKRNIFAVLAILTPSFSTDKSKKKVMKIICINFEWISSNNNNNSNRDESLSEEQIKREDNDDMSRQMWWENQKSVYTQLYLYPLNDNNNKM